MKKIISLLPVFIVLVAVNNSNAQGIINTLGSGGTFSVKDNSSTFLSVSQSNGTISIISPFEGNQRGSIFKGTNRFLHTYYGTGANGHNTFLGLYSGNFTMSGTGTQSSYNTGIGEYSLNMLSTGHSNSALGYNSLGSNNTGYENSAFGAYSLIFNSAGYKNSAFGYNALYTNELGDHNSAFGHSSLYSNTASNNSAYGFESLYSNTSGHDNSAFGYKSMRANTTAWDNAAFGDLSLMSNLTGVRNSAFGSATLAANTYGEYNSAFGVAALGANGYGNRNSSFGSESMMLNTSGNWNSAFGNESLWNNLTGDGNTAVGNYALYNSVGDFNTAIGDSSGTTIISGSNNISIGHKATVPNGLSSNQVRIGNTSITYAGVQVAWTITSDSRYKDNIITSPLGLNFISKLRPVLYTRKNDESKKTEFGLIAQEVEDVLKQEGIEDSGLLTITDEGMYELRYNDLFAPMIKAIQELKKENEELKVRLTKLEENSKNKQVREVKLIGNH